MKKTLTSFLVAACLFNPMVHSMEVSAQGLLGHTVQILAQWNQRSLNDVFQSIQEALASKDQVYTIQWGDTLSTISQATGIAIDDLMQINHISDPHYILAGDQIRFNQVTDTITYISKDSEKETVELDSVEGKDQGRFLLAQAQDFDQTSIITESVDTSSEIKPIEAVETTLYQEATSLEIAPTTPKADQTMNQPTQNMENVTSTQYQAVTAIEPITTTEESQTSTTETSQETTVQETTIQETSLEEITTTTASASMDPYAAFEQITAEKGVSAEEKQLWSQLINKESGWNPTASNAYSGAYGLPQALPGSKMASHGADWQTNPYTQLAWMYDYMIGRYGSITGAWQQSQAYQWY
ncbi:LysM peptidoglycan-binding domain-containing protein [Facklamia hominis]|uniref:aggregation-promoting factor C-terminal-like domain-containing protein n=1 Tax=Facklamia hominis TaxID=178214 RepID=UPI000C7D5212|nr:LysM peptidoglycan-binding domain-containing protein [Facklamia hominis]PKY92324.1 hypothetical protein CYJ56_08575 [Facklamia hominis]